MKPTKKDSCAKSLGRNVRSLSLGIGSFVWMSLSVLFCASPVVAQSQQPPTQAGASTGQQVPAEQLSGTVSGTVVDPSGAAVGGARVKFTSKDQSANREVLSDDDGQFSFADIAPGPFQLTITAEGFATQVLSGVLHPGETYTPPQIALALATETTAMLVEPPLNEVAEEQIREEEKQRVLGVIPNFYVSYAHHPVPLSPKQKFELAWKTMVDPVTFGINGAIAGIQQAGNDFAGYGQGAQGYGKRYGADFADSVTGIFIGGAILPSLLKQDPRYFYKGTGSTRSRILYAIANSVICKGDNGHWQANYSSVLGSLASGGISNLYYPESNRNGAALTFENTAIGIGATAAANLLEEFLVRKLTRNVPAQIPATP